MSANTCKSTSHLGTLLRSADRVIADCELFDLMGGGKSSPDMPCIVYRFK
jgi:hypothetical protein